MIDYTKRINTKKEVKPLRDVNISIESDRGRIISSASFRRLQKRTQVFALELNAAVRSRLTHSLEVSQTSRYIAKTILGKLEESKEIEKCKLENLDNAFISTCEMASLLHDIGNPPFGHFAEMTINDWVEKNALDLFEKAARDADEDLKSSLKKDLCSFDGNAQAIRIVAKLQRMNLSFSQIASIIKYTRGAYEKRDNKDPLAYLKKKGGFFYSEKDLVEKIWKELEISSGHRYPLTYIMEAADDISYLIGDLEDAVDKGVLKKDEIIELIKKEAQELKDLDGSFLIEMVEKNYKRIQDEDKPYQLDLFLTLTKAYLTNALVKFVSDIFIENHQAIFDGSFNYALLDFKREDPCAVAVTILENVSKKYIYSHKEVEALEIQGYTILNGLLNTYKKILELSYEDMEKLVKGEKIECYLSLRLFKRVSKKQIASYSSAVATLKRDRNFYALEWYYRGRLILDYISGMTDDFALSEYRALTVS